MKDIKPSTLSRIFAADTELIIEDGQSPEEQDLIRYVRANAETIRIAIVKFTSHKPKRG
jgi:hypothetical protein